MEKRKRKTRNFLVCGKRFNVENIGIQVPNFKFFYLLTIVKLMNQNHIKLRLKCTIFSKFKKKKVYRNPLLFKNLISLVILLISFFKLTK